MIQLNDSNFLLFAAANYISSIYDMDEFNEDIRKFKYIKKLLCRYQKKNDLNVRLLLNHLVVLYNVFDNEALTKMLFYKVEKKYWSSLKTLLLYLNYMPNYIYINDERINNNDIPIDIRMVKELRTL